MDQSDVIKAEFGHEATDLLSRYARILEVVGVERGLIGPREVPRIWERHVLNCAVVARPQEGLIPDGATVIDVGSGAGLPGLVWAIVRPDLAVTLMEPLLRRANFLTETVADLGLEERVQVVRARAEDKHGVEPADIVTARAVASLDKLVRWTLPLVRVSGDVVALKGSSAADEVGPAREIISALGGAAPTIHTCGADLLEVPTTVVAIRRVLPGKPSRVRETRGTRKPTR